MGESRAAEHHIVLVGGAYMLLHHLRETTHDVDTVTRLSEPMMAAIRQVAGAEGLPETWLNDRAAAFAPQGLVASDCREVLHSGPLLVREAPAWAVMLMKINALRARGQDLEDARALWPLSGYSDVSELLTAYYRAYPDQHPDEDPYLSPWLEQQLGS